MGNMLQHCETMIEPRKAILMRCRELVLPRFTQASSDSPGGKYGKNSLELAQLWSWLNPLLFGLALFVAIGDCPVKQCYSSLTGFAAKAVTGRTYLA